MSLLTELQSLNASAEAALTQFASAYDPENPPWQQKKEKGMGGAVAGAAAIGAGGYGVHRAVMKNAASDLTPYKNEWDASGKQIRDTAGAPTVRQSYSHVGGKVKDAVQEAGQKVANRWNNPMGNKAMTVDPTTTDRVKSSATTARRQGKQLLKKLVRSVFHYSEGPLLADLTEMNAQAEEAIQRMTAKG